MTATHVTKKALWLYLFISEIFDKKLENMTIFSDNQSIIVLKTSNFMHIQNISIFATILFTGLLKKARYV